MIAIQVEKHKDSVIYIMSDHGHSKEQKKAFKPAAEVQKLIKAEKITSQYEMDHAVPPAGQERGGAACLSPGRGIRGVRCVCVKGGG